MRLALALILAVAALAVPLPAWAAVSSLNSPTPSTGDGVTSWVCKPARDFSCTSPSGYAGSDNWGYAASGSRNQYGTHNCTAYAAYRLEQDGVADPGALGKAQSWAANAAARGIAVDQTPTIGSIAQWNSGEDGHVAYVEDVRSDGAILVSSDNFYTGTAYPSIAGGYTYKAWIPKGAKVWPANFIHFQPKYGAPKITAVKFHDGGPAVTFTAPALPTGTTIRGYQFAAYDAATGNLWSSGSIDGGKSPLVLGVSCGADHSCKYKIRALVDGGASAWSNTVATTGITAPKITAVKFHDGGPAVTFTAPALPTGTTIRGYQFAAYDAATGNLWSSGSIDGGKSPLVLGVSCGADHSCKYKIRALVDGGASAWSNTVATTGITAPKITAVKFHDGGPAVTFTAPALPTGTTIRGYQFAAYDAATGNLWSSGSIDGGKSPLVLGVSCGADHSCKYKIRALVDGGASAWSNMVTG